MNPQDVINALLNAEPLQIKEVFAALAKGFGQKAESIYDTNPEENGLIAQPYADLSDLCSEASLVFEEPDASLASIDESFDMEEATPATVTQAVEARAKLNPWGNR
jgi:hypothetical protein